MLQVRVHEEDDSDPLNLELALRAALRGSSHPVARTNVQTEPMIVYLDTVVDEVPGALLPRVQYDVIDGLVRARLRLMQNGLVVADRSVEFKQERPDEMARTLMKVILEESEKVK